MVFDGHADHKISFYFIKIPVSLPKSQNWNIRKRVVEKKLSCNVSSYRSLEIFSSFSHEGIQTLLQETLKTSYVTIAGRNTYTYKCGNISQNKSVTIL